MDEIVDLLTEFAPVETLVSILAGLLVLVGVAVAFVAALFEVALVDQIGVLGGLLIALVGVLLFAASSFLGEALETIV